MKRHVLCGLLLGCSGAEPGDDKDVETSESVDDTEGVESETDAPSDSEVESDTDAGWDPVQVPAEGSPPVDLADLNLFRWDPENYEFTFNDGVVPYELNAALFSDYAEKVRAIFVPEGQAMQYDPTGPFEFPVGSLILKNFMLPADLRDPQGPRRLVETRLLILQDTGWQQWPYVWNEQGTQAMLDPAVKCSR